MQQIFGRAKPSVSFNETIAYIDHRAGSIDNQIARIENDILIIKKHLPKSTVTQKNTLERKALMLLKKRKALILQRDSISQQSYNLQQVKDTSESLKITQLSVIALSDASKSISKQMSRVNLESVENLQDDIKEQMSMASDIQEMMSRDYSGVDIDEDDLNKELQQFSEAFDGEADYLDIDVKDPVPQKAPPILNPQEESDTDDTILEPSEPISSKKEVESETAW